ncbi:hypothetical protein E1262_28360 [Jiangella aurantiaca]|uniref:TrwC relaxase domain-containing protein n=1 Tax=Jiangella aurantiaca TaxID=2530373 RepID=A0A4R5A0L5_9ACTN|nr:hypothetical protein E1262_28360 [Jiangella aurantiaca]
MISIKELHAGDGYRYLLRGIVADSDQMPGISAVTAYYTEAGNPPGRWMGSGLAGLAEASASAAAAATSPRPTSATSDERRATTGCLGRTPRRPPATPPSHTGEPQVAYQPPGSVRSAQLTWARQARDDAERADSDGAPWIWPP